jgi:hypothetical protein
MAWTEGLCASIQEKMIAIYGSKAPALQRTPTGYLDALQSAENKAGITAIPVNDGTGKKRIVRITGYSRGVVAETSTDPEDFCLTQVTPAPYENDVEADLWFSLPGLTFNETDMRKICDPDSMWIAEILNTRLDAFAVGLDAALLALQNANYGNFIDGSNATHVIYPINSEGEAQPLAEELMLNEYADINGVGRPIVVGAGNMRIYSGLTAIGCCNDGGVDVSQAGRYAFYFDRQVGAAFGDNNDFVVMQPGSVQLITWNRFVGAYAKSNDLFVKGTVTDPKNGLTVDMYMTYEPCADGAAEGQYILSIGVYYNLVFLPTDSYQATDPLYLTNGTLSFNADCGDYTCDDLPSGSII